MQKVQQHISILGFQARDRVTGFSGVVSSVSFDLYGCIQAWLTPGIDKEGKPRDGTWFDVSRLEMVSKKPVMNTPNYDFGPVADGKQGAEHKAAPGQRY